MRCGTLAAVDVYVWLTYFQFSSTLRTVALTSYTLPLTPYSPAYVSWAYGLPVLYTIGKGIAIGDRLVFEVAYLRALLRAP